MYIAKIITFDCKRPERLGRRLGLARGLATAAGEQRKMCNMIAVYSTSSGSSRGRGRKPTDKMHLQLNLNVILFKLRSARGTCVCMECV